MTGWSRGIGKGVAEALRDAGALVYVTGRRVDQIEGTWKMVLGHSSVTHQKSD